MADSQKFIARNRAPRVQIEYDVEVYGAEKKVQLPFVMGVMSDLSGKSEVDQGSLDSRKFLEIDVDNFDDRMKAMKPRAQFSVPNTLTGEGNLSVDLTFEKMDDFSPAAIASKVEPLRKLLQARTQLDNLMTYMDGKSGAEGLIETLLQNPAAFSAILSGGAVEGGNADVDDVLAAMKAAAPQENGAADTTDDVLAAMAAAAPDDVAKEDKTDDVLASMAAAAPDDVAEDDGTDDVLAAMAEAAPEDVAEDDGTDDVLAAMAEAAPEDVAEDDGTDDVLAAMAEAAPEDVAEDDGTDDVLAAMAEAAPEDVTEDDGTDDVLAAMAEAAPEDVAEDDGTDDVLAAMADAAPEDEAEDDGTDDVLAAMAEVAPEDDADDDDDIDALLADVAEDAPEDADDDGDIDALLADVAEDAPDDADDDDGIDALLADVAEDAPEGADDDDDNIDALLADVAEDAPEDADDDDDNIDALLADVAEDAPEDADDDDDIDALLADVADDAPEDTEDDDDIDALLSDDDDTDIDALLADDDDDDTDIDVLLADDDDDDTDLDALLADDDDDDTDLDALLADDDDGDADLDALLADDDDGDTDLDALLADDDDGDTDLDALLADDDDDTDLDALLADDDDDDTDLDALLADGDDDDTDLDALLGGDDDDDGDLDALLGDDDDDDDAADSAAAAPVEEKPKAPYNPAFGKCTAPKPEIKKGDRRRMRVAILGDFSGRANKGELQGGADLAARKPIKFDIDTVEDIIERFATTLTLPVGKDGSAIAVELADIDALHPDELFDNVELFNELRGLRMQVARGTGLDQLKGWGEEFGDFALQTRARARGAKANANLQVSEFAQLIGGEVAPPPEPTGVDAMIQRVVGPYVVAAPDAGQEAMLAAVDQALSAAMSSILHHPDFQAVEANWRTLDMLARRIETGSHMEMVLYDVSVEEFTADLAAHEDLGESALYDMLVERPRLSEDQGPLAAVFGMYTFEEVPPHAELLARMSQICAHMDAPFVAGMGADFLKTKPDDLHPLIAKTWAAFRDLPSAKYIGLASPRFLLRMPYGKKTDPVDPFDYEEFNTTEGLRSMLFGNPAALVAVLLGKTLAEQGSEMSLGSIMSVDDMPFHYMTDQYGDQVALPSTERLLNERMATDTRVRGYMPVLSIQGQNVVRLASFNALGGGELLGLWAGEELKALQSGQIQARTGVSMKAAAAKEAAEEAGPAPGGGGGGDDDDDFSLGGDDDLDLDLGGDDFGSDDDLGDLLSGFDDDAGGGGDDDGMDDDLEALLADL